MVRIGRMAREVLRMNRRDWMAGFGAASLGLLLPGSPLAQGRPAIAIKAQQGGLGIRNGGPETPIWMLGSPELRFRRGEDLQVEFANDLTVPIGLDWRGIGGVPAIEPLISRRMLAPSGWENIRIPLRHAGTFLCDMILLDLQNQRQARGRPLVVAENQPVSVDRDEVLMVEEWRLRADGTAVVPGATPAETTTFYTLNGKASVDVSVRSNERLRLRFINRNPSMSQSWRSTASLRNHFWPATARSCSRRAAGSMPSST
jgi:hypothetical protein